MKMLLAVIVLLGLVGATGVGALAYLRQEPEASEPCAVTVAPGEDVSRALEAAAADATVCLAAGVHRAVTVARPREGITLRGAGAGTSVIEAERKDGLDLTDAERFTLADLSVRGGEPAGIYATRVRGLTLRGVVVEGAATSIHVEGGTATELTDVRLSGSRDFGLLVRRGASLTARGLRITDHHGIGLAAVDQPGAITLQESELLRADGDGRGENLVLNGFERFTLTSVLVRGGNPAGIYAAKARELILRGVRSEGALFGLHLDENENANANELVIEASAGVGLLLQRGGTINGRAVRVLDARGTGVSAINGAGLLHLRESEIHKVAAAGLFAGVAGCADLPPASLAVPDCFRTDLPGQISTIRVLLEKVTLRETQGPCLVFFPGVKAEVKDSTLTKCELTGLFAWGATVDVSNTLFEDNAEHALEYRAYPNPLGAIVAPASGTIQDSVVRTTRPLVGEVYGSFFPAPVLGGGILAQGARLVLLRNEVNANHDVGIAFVNRSSGEVVENRITGNGSDGLCIFPGNAVQARGNMLSGNYSDNPNVCGGLR